MSSGVCAALAEIGAREAAISLAINPGADIAEFSLRRMVERFGADGEAREALLSRPFLPAAVRNALVNAAAASLSAFVVNCGWLTPARAERLSREERDKANVIIVADTVEQDGRVGVRDLVQHLCASGQLTASLLLRGLLSDNRDLFEAALAELSGLRDDRVAGLTRDFRGAGFAALYARAGLPEKFLPAFRAVLAAQQAQGAERATDTRLSLPLIRSAIAVCAGIGDAEFDPLMALLRRFEREAALEDARRETARLAAEALAPEALLAEPPAPEPPALAAPEPAPEAEPVPQPAPRPPLIDLAAFDAELRQAA